MFFFPGLSSRPWHDPAEFAWCQEMEKNVPGIRKEYENLVHGKVWQARVRRSTCVKLLKCNGRLVFFSFRFVSWFLGFGAIQQYDHQMCVFVGFESNK